MFGAKQEPKFPTHLRPSLDEADHNRVETEIARLPHPVKSDPLAPEVAKLMDRAIIERGESYVQRVLGHYERRYRHAEEMWKQAQVWAESERARHREQAEGLAADHHEMIDALERFNALPRAPQLEAPKAEQTKFIVVDMNDQPIFESEDQKAAEEHAAALPYPQRDGARPGWDLLAPR